MTIAGIPLRFTDVAFEKSLDVLYWSSQLVAVPFSVHEIEACSSSIYSAGFNVGLGQELAKYSYSNRMLEQLLSRTPVVDVPGSLLSACLYQCVLDVDV